jgi:hypothetical protein
MKKQQFDKPLKLNRSPKALRVKSYRDRKSGEGNF